MVSKSRQFDYRMRIVLSYYGNHNSEIITHDWKPYTELSKKFVEVSWPDFAGILTAHIGICYLAKTMGE